MTKVAVLSNKTFQKDCYYRRLRRLRSQSSNHFNYLTFETLFTASIDYVSCFIRMDHGRSILFRLFNKKYYDQGRVVIKQNILKETVVT